MSAIVDLLTRCGAIGRFRQVGGRMFGPCPVHGGDNPRAFVVDLVGERWYCFTRCRRGGGAATLAGALRLEAPRPQQVLPRVIQPFRPYVQRLWLEPEHDLLRQKRITRATALDREVGAWHGGGLLAGCVAVRLHDANGAALGYAGRRLDPAVAAGLGKWMFPRAFPKSDVLYGLHRARGDIVVITECPWGVLRLAQLGVASVALLGTRVSPAQLALLGRFDRIVVLLDGDAAGRAAAVEVAKRVGDRAVLGDLPEGADADDLSEDDLGRLVFSLL
jgi:DNA primase